MCVRGGGGRIGKRPLYNEKPWKALAKNDRNASQDLEAGHVRNGRTTQQSAVFDKRTVTDKESGATWGKRKLEKVIYDDQFRSVFINFEDVKANMSTKEQRYTACLAHSS
jgi:hypothetical protein